MSRNESNLEALAKKLSLHGLLAHWEDYKTQAWLPKLLEREESERKNRGFERRINSAKIGSFKDLSEFDWSWPKSIDREALEELFELSFLDEGANVILVGPNGVGKSTLAQNLVYQAILQGHTGRFVTASELLGELAGEDSETALSRKLKAYARLSILAIDEIGYLSYDNRYADLLFEIVSRRNLKKSIILTTNLAFSDWGQVFPNASCVVALVDRLVHRAEIIQIKGESYRLKEAKEREVQRKQRRKKKTRRKGRAR